MRKYLLLAGLLGVVWCSTSWAATITVNSPVDESSTNGWCSLREAITNANNNAVIYPDCSAGETGTTGIVDQIVFNIQDPIFDQPPYTIYLYQYLPHISDSLAIHGESQPGSSCGPDGQLQIILDGSGLPDEKTLLEPSNGGIYFGKETKFGDGPQFKNNLVKGLVINGFKAPGIRISWGTSITNVQCNVIGVDQAGNTAKPNKFGIVANGIGDVIGGPNPEDMNVIGGNVLGGIVITGRNSSILGNLIGVGLSGNALPNKEGIYVFQTTTSLLIKKNIISRNVFNGILVNEQKNRGTTILENKIIDNGALGVDVSASDLSDGQNTNDLGDLDVCDFGPGTFFAPDCFVNHPVIDHAEIVNGNKLKIDFTLNSLPSAYRVEFFGNHEADSSGYGEGEVFLGSVDVNAPGSISTHTATLDVSSVDPSKMQFISANMTQYYSGELKNTSEFSSVFGLSSIDYGDAPDPAIGVGKQNYQTREADQGASQVMDPDSYLGRCVDGDSGLLEDINASLDDKTSGLTLGKCLAVGDDEDGVTFKSLVVGKGSSVSVIVHGSGYLNGWIDFNQNGVWSNEQEKIIEEAYLTAGVYTFKFNVPGTAVEGKTYARFRFRKNKDDVISYRPYRAGGPGEVEDYAVTVLKSALQEGEGQETMQWSPAGRNH